MIPLADSAGGRHGTPWLTMTLIVINAIAFLYTIILDPEQRAIFHFRFGVVPLEFTDGELFDSAMALPQYAAIAPIVPSWMTLFTSMFLHGGWAHILGNMLFLWVFGDNLEHHFGRVGFLVFYLATGVLASATHILFNWDSGIPAIGASGAIAGILGAYLLLFPRRRIRTLFMAGFITVMEIPAIWLLVMWMVIQLFSGVGGLVVAGGGGGVAYWAHVGGFIAGAAIVAGWRILRRERVWQPNRYETDTAHLYQYDDEDDDDYPPTPPGYRPYRRR